MKAILIVTADTNDADYVTKVTEISDKELVEITPIISAIEEFRPYKTKYGVSSCNYPTGENIRSDLDEKSAEQLYGHILGFNLFNDEFIPHPGYGIHSIETIQLIRYKEEDAVYRFKRKIK